MKKVFAIAAALCMATSVMADRILTDNGDVITGKVTGIKAGKVTIETAFAGELSIDRELITEIEYENDANLFVRTDATSRDKVEVSVSRDTEGNVLLIPVSEKREALALDDVSTLWATDDADPDFPPVKLWSFSASFGMTGHKGSSDDLTVSAYLDAVRTTEKTTLKLYASMNKARSEGGPTAEQYIGGLDFERRPAAHWSWYVRDEMQRNIFSDYNFRNVLGAGAGYYFWNTVTDGRTSLLRFRLGLAHTYINHTTQNVDNDSDIALDLGLLFHYDFACGIAWNTEITYTPIISDLSNGVVVHETKLSYLMKELGTVSTKLDNISLDLGMRNEYQTKTEGDVESTDTTWYLRLSKSW